MMKSISLRVLPPAVLLVVFGCNSNSSTPTPCGTDNVATTTADRVYATNVEAGLYFASVDPVPFGLFTFTSLELAAATPQATTAASAVVKAASTNFPNGCSTATASQNVVTFRLNNCSGPLGITNLSGVVTATINLTGNGVVEAQLAGTNITSNGANFVLNTSSVTALNSGGQKLLTATSMTTGTGPDGNSIAHGGTYTMLWPTSANQCATINGTFTGVTPADAAPDAGGPTTTISNYVACTGQCATSGTTTTTAEGQSVTLTYNGTSTAQCTASNGQNAGVAIQCP
jgi:hypothetical protein